MSATPMFDIGKLESILCYHVAGGNLKHTEGITYDLESLITASIQGELKKFAEDITYDLLENHPIRIRVEAALRSRGIK